MACSLFCISNISSRKTAAVSKSVDRIKDAAKKLLPQTNRQVTVCKNDPVIISSGLNRQTNTDISVETFGRTYAVKRYYAPFADRGGLLGKFWASDLDACIIRGVDPDQSERIKKLKDALSAIQEKKAHSGTQHDRAACGDRQCQDDDS